MTTPQQPNSPQQQPTPPQGSPFDAPPPQQAPPQQYAPAQPPQYAPQAPPQQYAPQPSAPQGPPPQQPPAAPAPAPQGQPGGYGSPESAPQSLLTKEPQQPAPTGAAPAGPVPGQAPGAPAPQAGYAMPAGVAPYQSSMPAPKTHLGHALASEWTKIRSVRSTVWALVVMFLLTAGIGVLVGVAVNTEDYALMPVLGPNFYGLMLGQLAIISMGVLVITSEYTTGMIRTTMTACPQRSRVLTAKAIVFFLLSFLMTLVATGLTGLVNSSMLSGKSLQSFTPNDESREAGEAVATSSEWLAATVGASLYVALLGVLAMALGALLRSSPAAITIMIGLVLLPIVISFFLMMSEKTQDLSEKFREYSPLNGLSTLHRFSMGGDPDASGWPLLGLLAGVTAVAMAAAYARLSLRDV